MGARSALCLGAARRVARVLIFLAPTLWIVGGDAARRAHRMAAFDRLHALGYAASVAGTAIFWALLLYVACARGSRIRHVAGVFFAGLFTLSTSVEASMFSLHHTYYTTEASTIVDSIPWALVGALPLRPVVVFHVALSLVTSVALLAVARLLYEPRRRLVLFLLFPVPLAAVVFAGDIPISYARHQSTSPDLIYFHAVGRAIQGRIAAVMGDEPRIVYLQRRAPPSLPALHAAPSRPRNVLVILQEAERADVICSAYEAGCSEANHETNKLLPGRLPLLRMRSNSSSTLISVAVLMSGLDPTEPAARIHSAPFVWDLAHAAGYDAAFWTNQNPVFGNLRFYYQGAPLSFSCSGTELDHLADFLAGPSDDLLTERVIRDWDQLREPFFAVVEYSNIHYPRVFDKKRAPFQPSDPWKRGKPWRNYYKNVVYLSDLAVARLVRHVRESPSGPRTVIVYTSDHGEALAEHENDNFHASTVYDEELRVPGFIDAPQGTLSPAEERAVRGHRDDQVFHLDLAPTFLDLLGIWDAPGLAPYRASMHGRPLTRPERAQRPVPVTNISWVWEYWHPNWGLIDYPMKIVALPGDDTYQCYDLVRDPKEKNDLGPEGCPALINAAKEQFGVMPADLPKHLRAAPRWGKRRGNEK